MENLSLLDASKPEKLKEVINVLIDDHNTQEETKNITKETLGLGNVDNTSDNDKPVSFQQKQYIDSENANDVKLSSETPQEVDSDIVLTSGKGLFGMTSNNGVESLISVKNEDEEKIFLGSANLPLKLEHKQDSEANNPVVNVYDESGNVETKTMAFTEDTIPNNVLENAETPNGVVSDIDGSLANVGVDEMSLEIVIRSVKNGSILKENIIPLKLASTTTRGLMSKENVQALNDLITRVAAIEGRASRYLYTESTNPTAEDIENFVISLGHTDYTGIAVVVEETYHVWHYYANDNIGWRDDGSDSVNMATNTSLGIVIGSSESGKISVESDGTMSLVGYDAMVAEMNSKVSADDVQTMLDEQIGSALGGEY